MTDGIHFLCKYCTLTIHCALFQQWNNYTAPLCAYFASYRLLIITIHIQYCCNKHVGITARCFNRSHKHFTTGILEVHHETNIIFTHASCNQDALYTHTHVYRIHSLCSHVSTNCTHQAAQAGLRIARWIYPARTAPHCPDG